MSVLLCCMHSDLLVEEPDTIAEHLKSPVEAADTWSEVLSCLMSLESPSAPDVICLPLVVSLATEVPPSTLLLDVSALTLSLSKDVSSL